MGTRIDFADELEDAANRIAHISRADLQIILRRAVLRLRNTEGIVLDQDVGEAVNALAADLNMTRQAVANHDPGMAGKGRVCAGADP